MLDAISVKFCIHTLPVLRNFKLSNFRIMQFLKIIYFFKVTFFLKARNFS